MKFECIFYTKLTLEFSGGKRGGDEKKLNTIVSRQLIVIKAN